MKCTSIKCDKCNKMFDEKSENVCRIDGMITAGEKVIINAKDSITDICKPCLYNMLFKTSHFISTRETDFDFNKFLPAGGFISNKTFNND